MIYTSDIYQQDLAVERKTAKLFYNGRSQAVRLPKEFRLPGEEVYIRRDGNDVVLSPVAHPAFKTLGDVATYIGETFGPMSDGVAESILESRRADRKRGLRDITKPRR